MSPLHPPSRFFIYYLILFSMSVFSTAVFRTIASFARDETLSQVRGGMEVSGPAPQNSFGSDCKLIKYLHPSGHWGSDALSQCEHVWIHHRAQ